MKYAGRTVPKRKYKLGTRVHIATRKGSPTGRITKDVYEGKGYGWSYKVKLDEGGTDKYYSEKSLRKVRSDARKKR